jgi:M-phase inducer tyrosine phosphatase
MTTSSSRLKSHFSISNFSLPSMKKKLASNSFTKVIKKIKFNNEDHSDSTDIDSDLDDTIIDSIDDDQIGKSLPLSNITNIQHDSTSPTPKISSFSTPSTNFSAMISNDYDDDDDDDENEGNNPSSPTIRPNRQIRRIHSFFQTTKEKESYQNLENTSNLVTSGIKTFTVSNDLFPRISCNELSNLIASKNSFFTNIIIVDCRFSYEYNGGHIKLAINLSDKSNLSTIFDNHLSTEKQLIIFHCEFSILRGPTMAQQFRRLDRQINIDNYPYLSYPDILILDGGYCKFFSDYKHLCDGSYIEMKNINYEKLCDLEFKKVKQDSKLMRAKSYNQFNLNNCSNPNFLHNNHSRSNSYTTITSEKIIKRQKSDSNVKKSPTKLKPSLSNISSLTRSNVDTIFNSSMNSNYFDDNDFQPPTTSFGPSHRKSNSSSYSCFSLSNSSIDSSMSSISSDNEFSNATDTDSLAETSSPIREYCEYFDKISTFHSTSSIPTKTKSLSGKSNGNFQIRISTSLKDCLQTLQLQPLVPPITQPSFQFPHPKSKIQRPSLRIGNTSWKISSTSSFLNCSPTPSPNLNSDKSGFPIFELSNVSNNLLSSFIDPINETPADFSTPSLFINNKLPTISTARSFNRPSRKRSGSSLSMAIGGLPTLVSSDMDEVDEENENVHGVLSNFKIDHAKIIEEED